MIGKIPCVVACPRITLYILNSYYLIDVPIITIGQAPLQNLISYKFPEVTIDGSSTFESHVINFFSRCLNLQGNWMYYETVHHVKHVWVSTINFSILIWATIIQFGVKLTTVFWNRFNPAKTINQKYWWSYLSKANWSSSPWNTPYLNWMKFIHMWHVFKCFQSIGTVIFSSTHNINTKH